MLTKLPVHASHLLEDSQECISLAPLWQLKTGKAILECSSGQRIAPFPPASSHMHFSGDRNTEERRDKVNKNTDAIPTKTSTITAANCPINTVRLQCTKDSKTSELAQSCLLLYKIQSIAVCTKYLFKVQSIQFFN